MARRIKAVGVVISGPEGGIEWAKVGETKNGMKVAEIKDLSNEYEDHVHSEYGCYDEEGKVIHRIMNCPVMVDYYEV